MADGQQQTVPSMGEVAGAIMAGGPGILTPQQMVQQTGISPMQLGTGGIQPASRSLIPPPLAGFRPQQMQSVPWNASLEARRTVKQQNLGTMLGNLAGSIGQRVQQKQFADKVDVIQKGTTALDQIQKAKQLAAMYPDNLQIQQLAKKTMSDNEALLTRMSNDPKQSKILQEAKLDFTNPKEISTDENKQAAVQALKNVQAGQQAGTNANTPEEKRVQDLLAAQKGTQAPVMSPQQIQAWTKQQIAQQTQQQQAQQAMQDPYGTMQQPQQATQPQAPTMAPGGPVPQGVSADISRWSPQVSQAATKYSVDPNVGYALMQMESGGNPNAVSSTGAAGLFQLTKGTAKGYGLEEVDRYDPDKNIDAGMHTFADAMKHQGNNPALAAAEFYSGPGAIQGGKIVDTKDHTAADTQAYMSKFMGIYSGMGTGGVGGTTGTAATPEPKKPDIVEKAATPVTSMGGPGVPAAVSTPAAAPKGLSVVDATKTPTPHLDAYTRANPTMMEQNPLYAQMLQRNAMMEKAYYEKMAPAMFQGYMKSVLQDQKLQSDQFRTYMNAWSRFQIAQMNNASRERSTGVTAQNRLDAAKIASDGRIAVEGMRIEGMIKMQREKESNPYAMLKTFNTEYARNTLQMQHVNGMITQAENARQNALASLGASGKSSSEAIQSINDQYDGLIDKYRSEQEQLGAFNDELRVATNQAFQNTPGLSGMYQQAPPMQFGGWMNQMPQGGGGYGGGAGAVSPFFNQQQSQSAQQSPTSGAGGITTPASTETQINPNASEADIIGQLLNKAPRAAAPGQ